MPELTEVVSGGVHGLQRRWSAYDTGIA